MNQEHTKQMQAHADNGGTMTHLNAVELLARITTLETALKDIRRRCLDYERINLVGPPKAGTIRNVLLLAGDALGR